MSEGGPSRMNFDDKGSLFSWIVPALKNKRALKTWIRCCVALAATLILMVSEKTLSDMGQAGFFAAIVAVMLPPYLALSLFVFATITILLGMLVGWAWGAAAMAAALSVRSQALLAQQQQAAQSMIVQGVPISFQQQKFVFSGLFLDPRSSAVYGAFFFIGTFALGALRAYIPKLSLLSIFGTIVLDIMCSYGPSFPSAQYTIAKTFLVPTGYYVAVAVASIILLFPESMNHVWLTNFRTGFLKPTFELLTLQSTALQSQPSNHDAWSKLVDKGNLCRRELAAGSEGLQGQVALVDLEISVGRLGPTDLKKISKELKSLMFRSIALHSFQSYVNDMNVLDEKEAASAEAALNSGSATPRTEADRYMRLRKEIKEREKQQGHDLDTLIPILADASSDLRTACEDSMKGVRDWFQNCNSKRWAEFFTRLDEAKVKERHESLEAKLSELETALSSFRKSEKAKLISPFKRFFDPQTGKVLESVRKASAKETFAARSLFMCFVFTDSLDTFAERLIQLLHIIVDLDARRPKARIWAPSGFGKIWRKLTSRAPVDNDISPLMSTSKNPSGTEDTSSNGEDSDSEDDYDILKTARKNPDALPPRTAVGKFFVSAGGILRFLKSHEGIFALRHAIVSIALWIPSVCTSSAWFNYENRGLWALIMAQTGLAMYAGDQIYEFVIRIFGTVVGLLVGMATWYIGAGKGKGNPYGIVVATTVLTAPFIFGRLNAPIAQMTIWVMTGVTIIFVVGYSWIDTHLPVLVNSGVGIHLGWKRALLVIIGFAGAFVVMIFPHPNSARTLVRRTLGGTALGLGHIFAEEVEAFLAEEALARRGQYEKVEFMGEDADLGDVSAKEKRVRKLANRFISVATRLQAIEPSLQTARFEPQLQGTWPYEQYQKLYKLQMQLLLSLVLLISAFPRLDTRWCSILVHRTPFLNPNLLSDIFSHLSIISNALSGAHALPVALPSLRDRVIYHERHSKSGRPCSPIRRSTLDNPDEDIEANEGEESSGNARLDFAAGKVDGSSIGFEEITLDILMDEHLPAHSTAVVALSNIISLIDEITTIVRSLCGEVSFRGYDMLQKSYLDREERAVGVDMTSKLQ